MSFLLDYYDVGCFVTCCLNGNPERIDKTIIQRFISLYDKSKDVNKKQFINDIIFTSSVSIFLPSFSSSESKPSLLSPSNPPCGLKRKFYIVSHYLLEISDFETFCLFIIRRLKTRITMSPLTHGLFVADS